MEKILLMFISSVKIRYFYSETLEFEIRWRLRAKIIFHNYFTMLNWKIFVNEPTS